MQAGFLYSVQKLHDLQDGTVWMVHPHWRWEVELSLEEGTELHIRLCDISCECGHRLYGGGYAYCEALSERMNGWGLHGYVGRFLIVVALRYFTALESDGFVLFVDIIDTSAENCAVSGRSRTCIPS